MHKCSNWKKRDGRAMNSNPVKKNWPREDVYGCKIISDNVESNPAYIIPIGCKA